MCHFTEEHRADVPWRQQQVENIKSLDDANEDWIVCCKNYTIGVWTNVKKCECIHMKLRKKILYYSSKYFCDIFLLSHSHNRATTISSFW